jgi:serine/threonine protein kinase
MLGPYRLLEPLGQGGVALVFRAEHEHTGALVAVKSVRAPREGLLASVRREMSILERLQHPGVIRIIEGGVTEGVPWYAMDLLEGDTLRVLLHGRHASEVRATSLRASSSLRGTAETVLNTGNVQPSTDPPPSSGPPRVDALPLASLAPEGGLAWFLTVIRRLCEPLAYVHGEGVVHRDLTPGNVFVLPGAMPILMDFGLVWRVAGEGGRGVISVDAARAGTIAYMSPEQARGDPVDARSDLFSLGCMMYEALTGRVPFPARSLAELIARHASGPPPKPEQHGVDAAPPLLTELVFGLLELDPRDRIGHASNVAAVLADMGAQGWPREVDVHPKAYLYRPRLVGRHSALKSVLVNVERLKERHGSSLFVSGESGIGKTSLAFEAARRASLEGIRVITGECAAVGLGGGKFVRKTGPLYPFSPLLQAVADRCVAGGPSVTEKLLGARAKVLAVTEPSLKNLPGVAEYPDPAEVPGDAARRRLIDALADTLSAFAAEQATLLVLEDLQWADDATLAFLASLSEYYYSTNDLLVIGTYRSEEPRSDLERLVGVAHSKHLRLERLDADAISAMASEMLAQNAVPARLARFLATGSSGNPFFVSEYLRAAVDAGLLYRDARGRWLEKEGEAAIEGLGLPKTLREIVMRRLESLPSAARSLAEAAATLGRDIEIDLLSALSLETNAVPDESAFDEGLRNLVTRHVLEPSALGSVRFSHDALREAAYERADAQRLRLLHAASAALLERRHREAGTLERAYAVLAHHFERAGADARALYYLDRAGEAAHAVHANHEALQLLTKADTLDAHLGRPTGAVDRARRLRLCGLNSLASGDLNGAFASLTEATRVAGRPWPATRSELALRCTLAMGRELGRRWIPTLRSAPPPSGTERELLLEAARAYERLFAVNYFNADMGGVAMSGLTNMALAERAGGATGELALGYATFGAMCSLSLMDGVAQSYCARAMTVARESHDEIAETWVLMNVAVVHLQAARWPETEECLERVRAMSHRLGFNRRWEEATTQFSTARLLAGRFDDASRLNDELLGAVERADPQSRCWAVVRRAELWLLRGDVPAAVRAAEDGERLCHDGLQRDEWVYALGPLALSLLRSGDLTRARAIADRCAEWIEKGNAPIFYNVFAYAAVAEVYFELWKRAPDQERAALLSAGRTAVRRLGSIARAMPIAAPRAELWRGMERLYNGAKTHRAARCFLKSAERADRLGMPYDRALALAALGEHASATAADARERLAEAASLFRSAGAIYDLGRVERLLQNA